MNSIHLYRKRLIPQECIELKEDEIVKETEEVLITRWKTIKPRKEFHHGASCYFLNKGYKVSKFMKTSGELYCWYCDIIKTEYTPETHTYIFTDLLADVVIMPDGFVKVLDLDELAKAVDDKLLTNNELKCSLIQIDALLKLIYDGKFSELKNYMNEI